MNDKTQGIYLLDYQCISSAGADTEAFWQGLCAGQDHSQLTPQGGRVCLIPGFKTDLYQDKLSEGLKTMWGNLKYKSELQGRGLCLISSTKGILEDYIWNKDTKTDPFTSLYSDIRQNLKLENLDFLTVSQACSSSHIAVEVAQHHLENNIYDFVIVVAFDFIGQFIYNGFHSLKVLSTTTNKPFAQCRDGLQLGEAMAILLFTQKHHANSGVKIKKCSNKTLPSSVTRPSLDGSCLYDCVQVLSSHVKAPDFFVAHGTGTRFNDLAEDSTLDRIAQTFGWNFKVTSTKWSVGHCLGASGALDLIAAAEILKRKEIFGIANTQEIDRTFKAQYIKGVQHLKKQNLQSAMITSLGFGGVHAALSLEAV